MFCSVGPSCVTFSSFQVISIIAYAALASLALIPRFPIASEKLSSSHTTIASFFLGAIDAYEGSITAFEKLEYAIKNAPEPIKIQALEQYAKVAILNDKSQEAEKIFAKYRKVVPFIDDDRYMHPLIEKSVEFIR